MSTPLSRRQFVAGLAAAGAALPLSRLAAQPVSGSFMPSAPGPYKKAVKLGMVGEGATVLEKFQLLRELGYDGVELDSPNGLDNEEVVAARDATGLTIHGVVDSAHWGKPFNHPDAAVRAEGVAALRTALNDAKAYGATTVLVVPAVVNKQNSYAAAWKLSRHEIGKTIPQAEELGIKIAFENVWNNFLLSPLETRRYIESFDSDHVGAYFDVGNVVRFAWPEHWIEALGDKILKIDVKEYSRKKQNDEGLWKGFQSELLEGDCDWPAVMKALKIEGYEGWFTAEVSGGNRDRLAFLADRMDRILASGSGSEVTARGPMSASREDEIAAERVFRS